MGHREVNIGNGFLILYLTPSKAVSPAISEPFRVVEVLPDYTLGGYFAALYHTDHDTLSPAYNDSGQGPGTSLEFRIITALTRCPAPDGTGRCKEKKGFYLSPVAPVKGSELVWEHRRNGIYLCGREGIPPCISLDITPITPKIPIRFHLTFIEPRGEGVVFERVLPATKPAISYSSIKIPSSSPLSELPFKSKIFSVIFSLEQVIVEEPKSIKGKVLKELKTGVYG
ncbi:MAG: hypothetical protein AABY44_06300 [Nitrospirota bacterium]